MLQHDIAFEVDDFCVVAFETLKKALVSATIITPPDWIKLFEIMCDVRDYVVNDVLGQRHNSLSLNLLCK